MFDPERLTRFGRFIFATAIAAFGVQNLICREPIIGLEPLPTWLPMITFWALATGFFLIRCGLGIALSGPVRRAVAAVVLGSFLLLWILLLHAPRLVASPANGSFWTCMFETLAVGSAAWVLAGDSVAPVAAGEPGGHRARVMKRLGQFGYGVSLPAFGVLHLVYWQYVASVIPAWLPGHLFWTYFTAAAFFAAGTGIIAQVWARQAALWTGTMFLLWVLMLHLPRVLANATSRAEWTSMLVALAMGGGAWMVAHTQPQK